MSSFFDYSWQKQPPAKVLTPEDSLSLPSNEKRLSNSFSSSGGPNRQLQGVLKDRDSNRNLHPQETYKPNVIQIDKLSLVLEDLKENYKKMSQDYKEGQSLLMQVTAQQIENIE